MREREGNIKKRRYNFKNSCLFSSSYKENVKSYARAVWKEKYGENQQRKEPKATSRRLCYAPYQADSLSELLSKVKISQWDSSSFHFCSPNFKLAFDSQGEPNTSVFLIMWLLLLSLSLLFTVMGSPKLKKKTPTPQHLGPNLSFCRLWYRIATSHFNVPFQASSVSLGSTTVKRSSSCKISASAVLSLQ